jgi:hypothetical protein
MAPYSYSRALPHSALVKSGALKGIGCHFRGLRGPGDRRLDFSDEITTLWFPLKGECCGILNNEVAWCIRTIVDKDVKW